MLIYLAWQNFHLRFPWGAADLNSRLKKILKRGKFNTEISDLGS
jgi:hypothetical protein